jgi:hypothetical protein
MTIIRTIPEPGQLVRLRQRQYVVTDVRQSLAEPLLWRIAPTRISSAGLQKSQHVVSLASIDPNRSKVPILNSNLKNSVIVFPEFS